ncbi:MAG TPA: hypothetical protein VIK82_10470, partial [Porticoccaceae bacterium]
MGILGVQFRFFCFQRMLWAGFPAGRPQQTENKIHNPAFSEASINRSRSPSSTAWVLRVST